MSARVVVADHSKPSRRGLRLALQRGGVEVIGEAGDAASLLALGNLADTDVVVLPVDLPGDGLRVAGELAQVHPRLRIIVLTASPTDDELVLAVLAGARGYLARDVAADRLPTIVEAVSRGEVAIPRRLSGRLLDELRARGQRRGVLPGVVGAALTPREWDVLDLLGDEKTTSEIANRLGITDVTVRRHISSLVTKLDVGDRRELVRLLAGRRREVSR